VDQAQFGGAGQAGAGRAVQEARCDGHFQRAAGHQRAGDRAGIHFQAFGHEGVDAEGGAADRRGVGVGEGLDHPLAEGRAGGQAQRPGDGAAILTRRHDLLRDLPVRAAQPQADRQVERLAGGVADQHAGIHRLAGAVDAAVEPQEGIDRAGMRAAGGATVGQVEGGGFEREGRDVVGGLGVDRDGRHGAGAAHQRNGEAHQAIGAGAGFRQDLVVAGHQHDAQAGGDGGGLQGARLHRQPVGTAPGGQADIGDEEGQGGRLAAAAPRFILAQHQQVGARAGGAQHIGQRQDGTMRAVGFDALELGAAFPQYAAHLLADVLGGPGFQALARRPVAAQRHQVALGHAHDAHGHAGDIDGGDAHARLLPAREDEGGGVEGDARVAVGHGDAHGGFLAQVLAVLARQAGAQDDARGGAPGQAGDAEQVALAFHRQVRDRRVGTHPVLRLPVGAARRRVGEGDAGAGGVGIGLGRDAADQHAGGAAGGFQPLLVLGAVGAFQDGFQRLDLLDGAVEAAQGFGDDHQRGDFRFAIGGELEGAPAGLQGTLVVRRVGGELRLRQRQPMVAVGLAHADAFFPGARGGGVVAPAFRLAGAQFRRGALLLGCSGGESACHLLLVGRGIARQPRQVEALRGGEARHREGEDQQQADQAHLWRFLS
jgi:hypothetical protein